VGNRRPRPRLVAASVDRVTFRPTFSKDRHPVLTIKERGRLNPCCLSNVIIMVAIRAMPPAHGTVSML